MMPEYTHVTHGFPPLFDAESRTLILGSMPSPKSREQAFYYGHPQNRFWRVLAAVFGAGYYGVLLRPRIGDAVTNCAVLAYILVSCLSMAAALGLDKRDARNGHPRFLFAAGIVMTFSAWLSDIKLGEKNFVWYYYIPAAVLALALGLLAPHLFVLWLYEISAGSVVLSWVIVIGYPLVITGTVLTFYFIHFRKVVMNFTIIIFFIKNITTIYKTLWSSIITG